MSTIDDRIDRLMQLLSDAPQYTTQGAVLLIDLEKALPKDLEHLYDDCHYTAKGNAVIADAIAQALLAKGLR